MWRITTVFSLYVCLFSIIVIRLFYWQIISGDSLRLQASQQYSLDFLLPASRGDILASDGSPLAMNSTAHLVFAQPKEIESISDFSAKISPVLDLEKEEVLSDLSTPGRIWVPLSHKVDGSTYETLKGLNLKGLGFEKEPQRYYPESSMAAHLLGFVGSDQNGRDKGYFGLEGYYDRELRGKDGRLQAEKDVRGSPIVIGEAKRVEAENGRSLVLWVDRTIQRIAEEKLKEGMTKYGAKEGTVSIMDPKTGGILAMASFPSYDPLRYSAFDKVTYKNPIVASTYEPGSTFKVLVMGAALNEHAVTAETTMEESGPVRVGEYTVKTWNNEYRGTQTMTEVIRHSSNVGMVFVAQKLGKEKLISYIRNFGFGQLTGIDLEEEASPTLRDDRQWYSIDLATASFGQGIAVTPLQMLRAVGALANDGWLMEPRMVKEIKDTNGKSVVVKPKKIHQVVGSNAARVMTEMMVDAVDNGEAKWAKPKGYRIAGKTGTAQIPVAGHYDEKKTIASFVGFAPADNPRFVMLVTLQEPTSSPWGSETAAPLFFAVARELFLYMGIPPQ